MLDAMTVTIEKRPIYEAATLVSESPREDGAWKVRIISEGQGSSGYYSRDLLEGYHHVFNDVLSFKNHPTGWDGPEDRDFTMIAGEILGETWTEDDERGMAAVYGWYLPDEEYRAKLERYKKKLGVSIFAMGEGEWDDRTGNFNVTEFTEDPYTSVDVVIAAGARGKILESAKKVYAHRVERTSAASAGVTEEEGLSEMAEKDVLDAIGKLTVAVEALTESGKKEAQATVDANALSTAVEAGIEAGVKAYADNIAAIDAAELLPSQEADLRDRAAKGEDITSAIESAKVIATEAREAAGKASKTTTETKLTTESAQFSEGAAEGYEFKGFGARKAGK